MSIPRLKMQRTIFLALALLATVSMDTLGAHGQATESRFSNNDLQVRVTPADRDTAGSAIQVSNHPNYARTPAGNSARNRESQTRTAAALASPGDVAGNAFTAYPADVIYQGGMVVQQAVSHPVYVNPGGACTIANCWGNPEGFLADLSNSDFIHVADEYTGETRDRRYTLDARIVLKDPLPSSTLSYDDLLAILHSVVMTTGEAGYGNIYHLFLPPGIDACFPAPYSDQCYSPDNPSTFVFCAFHASATFADLGQHVLFTVQPWQGAAGCIESPTGAPNGQLADSTNDALNHETFETISDPDSDAWWNNSNLVCYNSEIADECLFLSSDGYWVLPTFPINGKLYRVQSIYSNRKHACSISPQDF